MTCCSEAFVLDFHTPNGRRSTSPLETRPSQQKKTSARRDAVREAFLQVSWLQCYPIKTDREYLWKGVLLSSVISFYIFVFIIRLSLRIIRPKSAAAARPGPPPPPNLIKRDAPLYDDASWSACEWAVPPCRSLLRTDPPGPPTQPKVCTIPA